MFGNDKDDKKDDNSQPISTQPVNPGLLGIDDDNDTSASSASPVQEPTSSPLPGAPEPPVVSAPDDPALSTPSDNSSDQPTNTIDPVTSEPSTLAPSFDSAPSNDVAVAPESTMPDSSDDLVDIKRQALQELSPLIDHLDQDPEEKFKTTMMMIQASDDKDLIPHAFKAAKEITDEKQRAQALLDIVNEINYFTHKSED